MFYYNEYVCTGPAEDEADARKSFPSGHASVVCFVAAFVAVYLQRRSTAAVSAVFLLRPIIQVGNTVTRGESSIEPSANLKFARLVMERKLIYR